MSGGKVFVWLCFLMALATLGLWLVLALFILGMPFAGGITDFRLAAFYTLFCLYPFWLGACEWRAFKLAAQGESKAAGTHAVLGILPFALIAIFTF